METMSKSIAYLLVVLTSLLSFAKSQTWSGPGQLHPVHGLYVKPSSDGATGDLYVAASEDSGTKAQWLTDQPVNFLPPSTPQVAHEESSVTEKRAVFNPTVSPLQYAYALPFNAEGAPPYPYALPMSLPPETSNTQCEKAATAVPYNPFQFFYPQMMSAYANAKNVLKESGMSDEKAGSVIPQASPFWPNSYAYPPYPMYVMVDPSAWAQSQLPQPTFQNKETAA